MRDIRAREKSVCDAKKLMVSVNSFFSLYFSLPFAPNSLYFFCVVVDGLFICVLYVYIYTIYKYIYIYAYSLSVCAAVSLPTSYAHIAWRNDMASRLPDGRGLSGGGVQRSDGSLLEPRGILYIFSRIAKREQQRCVNI